MRVPPEYSQRRRLYQGPRFSVIILPSNETLILRVLLDQVGQLQSHTLNLCVLVVQGTLDLVNLLVDEAELLVSQIRILRPKLVEIDGLFLAPHRLDLAALLIDRHIQHLIEVGIAPQPASADQVLHDRILQLDGQFVAHRLLLARSELGTGLVTDRGRVSRDNVIQNDRVVLVQHSLLDVVKVVVKYLARFTNLSHLVGMQIVHSDRHLAARIHVNLVSHEE